MLGLESRVWRVWDRIYNVEPETVGECSSMRDKNGVLLYEHDRIIWDGRFMGTVVFQNGEFTIKLDGGDCCAEVTRKMLIECIGTIHDAKGAEHE